MWLLAIIVIETIIEVSLFVTVGGWLTLWPTLAIVVGTAVAGILLVRWQGTHVLRKAQREILTLHNPLSAMAHGALIALAGVLLILPGFFTDLLGVILLVPAVRGWAIRMAANRIADRAVSTLHAFGHPNATGVSPDKGAIDGDYSEIPSGESVKR